MPIVTVDNIEKIYGRRVLFDKASLLIDRGERIGLIGDNGTGKSTLFRMLMREDTPETGSISIARGVRIGHLEQNPTFDDANTVMDEAELGFGHLHDLSHKLRELEHDMAEAQGDELQRILDRYQTVQHDFDSAGGYAWRHRLEAVLQGVGLPESFWEQQVSSLSGGQRSRLALAKLLVGEPDVLLLDEPTNHLDLIAIEWLENYLLAFTGAVLLISHDRFLLDRLATRIVWLTRGKLPSYPGNYSAFVTQREVHELSQQRAYEQQQADIAKQQEFIRRFGAGQRSREAKGREKRLNRLLISDAMIDRVESSAKIQLSLDTDQRAPDRVLEVKELCKSYDGRTLWSDIGFQLGRGERVGIIGPNGAGKTTLLETVLGRRDADGGTLRWGPKLNIGYYDQQLGDLDDDATVFEEVSSDRDVTDQQVRNMLGMLLFRGEDIEKRIGMLSGGERARVRMAQLLLDKPNVLLLDEPTNHLDIASREALEKALMDYPGTILCISHDRRFLDNVVNRMLVLDPPGIIDFTGAYSAWMEKLKEKEAAAAKAPAPKAKTANAKPAASKQPAKPAQSSSPAAKPKKENAYARPFGRLTVKELERKIADTEKAIAETQSAMAAPAFAKDASKARALTDTYQNLQDELQRLEEEYLLRE